MKISSRTARIATVATLVGVFAIGGGVSSINASAASVKVTTLPPKLPARTKNGALPTTLPPKLPARTKNGALPPVTTLMPKIGRATTTTGPRVKNGKPKPPPSVAPKGS